MSNKMAPRIALFKTLLSGSTDLNVFGNGNKAAVIRSYSGAYEALLKLIDEEINDMLLLYMQSDMQPILVSHFTLLLPGREYSISQLTALRKQIKENM